SLPDLGIVEVGPTTPLPIRAYNRSMRCDIALIVLAGCLDTFSSIAFPQATLTGQTVACPDSAFPFLSILSLSQNWLSQASLTLRSPTCSLRICGLPTASLVMSTPHRFPTPSSMTKPERFH